MVKSQRSYNVVKITLYLQRCYNVISRWVHVAAQLAVYVVATLLVCNFHNVAKSQRCTTLY